MEYRQSPWVRKAPESIRSIFERQDKISLSLLNEEHQSLAGIDITDVPFYSLFQFVRRGGKLQFSIINGILQDKEPIYLDDKEWDAVITRELTFVGCMKFPKDTIEHFSEEELAQQNEKAPEWWAINKEKILAAEKIFREKE